MDIIENFDLLTEQEQIDFAKELVDKINAKHVFGTDVEFILNERAIHADETTGGLNIGVSHKKPVFVEREATWQCATPEDAEDMSSFSYFDFKNSLFEDAADSFTTTEAEVDVYRVALELYDVDETGDYELLELIDLTQEDSGIGHYEYFGATGYDSNPYCEVEGKVGAECECSLSFYVEAI
jgi:hypothetical protein